VNLPRLADDAHAAAAQLADDPEVAQALVLPLSVGRGGHRCNLLSRGEFLCFTVAWESGSSRTVYHAGTTSRAILWLDRFS
jgi:hypothetical protein